MNKIVAMMVSAVAAQTGCFDTIDGNQIIDCICDESCLTCRVGEPPSPDNCFTCFDEFDWMTTADGLDEDTGRCVAQDFGIFMNDDMRDSSNSLTTAVSALAAAIMVSQI